MEQKFNRSHTAFTLLEMVIVVGIIGLMIAAIMPAITQDLLRKRDAELNAKMDAIEAALMRYVQLNNRLPCPAVRFTNITSSSFGTAAPTPGTCTGSFPAGSNVRTGSIPVRTIGLPDSAAFDAWGRAFSYIVDMRATANNAFTTYPLDSTALTAITTNDGSGTARSPAPILLIISHGPNGHGGMLRDGASRYVIGVTNTRELANCNCSSTVNAWSGGTTYWAYPPASNAGALLDTFDDRVRFYTRVSFATPSERAMPY